MTDRITTQDRELDLTDIEAKLAEYEAARTAQLTGIDTSPDEVTAAYRETVERLLQEIRFARARIAEGRYGTCTRCGADIPLARLEWRPWAVTCTNCAR